MKKFTEQEVKNLIKDFLLVHNSPNNFNMSLYNKTFLYESGYSPFITSFMTQEHTNESIPVDRLEKYKLNNKNIDYYLLPNFIAYSGYIDSPEQKKLFDEWISISKNAKDIYFSYNENKEDMALYRQLLENENALIKKAKQLWNTITFESIDKNKLANPSTIEFWKYYENSSFYLNSNYGDTLSPKVNTSELNKNFIKSIINCFENYDDVLSFEKTIEKTNKRVIKEFQIEVWNKLMKKFVPHNSLEEFSPLLKNAYIELKTRTTARAEDKLKNLKFLQYMKFDLVKDVYVQHHNKPMTAGVADFTKKILDKYDKFVLDDDTQLIKSHHYTMYHHAEVELNMNLLKRSINHQESLERLINIIAYCFKTKEKEVVNFTFSNDKSVFKLDSTSEDTARNLEKLLYPYLMVALSPEFLTKSNVENFKDKNFYMKSKNSDKPSIAASLAHTLGSMALARKLDKSLDDDITINHKRNKI